jgi:CRP/FNR family cyclic AMP-dependent transcriptional regulator
VSRDDQLARLREIPALARLDDEGLGRIIGVSTEVTWPAGQVLARADAPGAGMFVVEEGTVVVEAPGRTIELGPGEIFGELSLLVPESRRAARVRATTPVRCLAIDRGAFERLLDEEPAFARAMLAVVAQRLWDVMRGQEAPR